MPVATRPRLFSYHLLPLLVVFAGLMSSCQSSRPSFAFQLAPRRAVLAEKVASTVTEPDSVGTTVAVVPAAPAAPLVARMQGKARRQVPGAVRMAAVAKVVLTPAIERSKLHQRRAVLQRPHATAEAGLGTTVLGVLGLIMLPIAALGLILSGGALGWIIVGGLAALAVLVAYIDPFGR